MRLRLLINQADYEPIMMLLALILLSWGVYTLLPFGRVSRLFVPEEIWGSVMTVIGIVGLIGVLRNQGSLGAIATVYGLGLWILLWITALTSPTVSSAVITIPWVIISEIWVLLRMVKEMRSAV